MLQECQGVAGGEVIVLHEWEAAKKKASEANTPRLAKEQAHAVSILVGLTSGDDDSSGDYDNSSSNPYASGLFI